MTLFSPLPRASRGINTKLMKAKEHTTHCLDEDQRWLDILKIRIWTLISLTSWKLFGTRVFLSLFTLAGGILAFLIIQTTEPRYESEISIKRQLNFQGQIASGLNTEISDWFFEPEYFGKLACRNPKTVLDFSAIDRVNVNGIEFQAQRRNSLVTFSENTLKIHLNDVQIIDEVFAMPCFSTIV